MSINGVGEGGCVRKTWCLGWNAKWKITTRKVKKSKRRWGGLITFFTVSSLALAHTHTSCYAAVRSLALAHTHTSCYAAVRSLALAHSLLIFCEFGTSMMILLCTPGRDPGSIILEKQVKPMFQYDCWGKDPMYQLPILEFWHQMSQNLHIATFGSEKDTADWGNGANLKWNYVEPRNWTACSTVQTEVLQAQGGDQPPFPTNGNTSLRAVCQKVLHDRKISRICHQFGWF